MQTIPNSPSWLWEVLGVPPCSEGESLHRGSDRFLLRKGILRSERTSSATQAQTSDAFGYKWQKRDTFESDQSRSRMREWLFDRYGRVIESGWFAEHGAHPILLDAGCGAALSAIE